jgi:hypothetical protein
VPFVPARELFEALDPLRRLSIIPQPVEVCPLCPDKEVTPVFTYGQEAFDMLGNSRGQAPGLTYSENHEFAVFRGCNDLLSRLGDLQKAVILVLCVRGFTTSSVESVDC